MDDAIFPAGHANAIELPFTRLDVLLTRATAQARERFGAGAAADAFRGLYVTAEQAAASLHGEPGAPLLAGTAARGAGEPVRPSWDEVTGDHAGWSWLRDTYGLTDQELDVVLVALAPEVDPRYERLYGYLQDDVNRRRPTVNLALDLVTTTVAGKLAARSMFRADAPLVSEHVVTLMPDERPVRPPLLAHFVALDEQIVDVLLLQGGLDRRLAARCRLTAPPPGHWPGVPLPASAREPLLATARAAREHRPLRLYFQGAPGSGRRTTAEALAGELRAPLLTLGLAGLSTIGEETEEVLFRAFREAQLHGALLYLDAADALRPSDTKDAGVAAHGPAHARRALAERLARHPGIVIMAGDRPWLPLGGPPLGVVTVPFARPGHEVRRQVWAACLAEAGVVSPGDLAEALAGRFRFGPGQIAHTVSAAVAASACGPASPSGPARGDLFAAARDQTGHQLAALARRITSSRTWDDLILPGDSTTQLRELCLRVTLRRRVWHDWAFGGGPARGKGVSALFAGPPGTGKTMAAEVVAGELGLDLFKIDLSSVISKYIGETEKNLERIFTAAADADAILLFDEADALFGKRSEVRDAHDRYANIETAYLLQRMEQHDGVAILATNLRQHLDDAFTRRLQFVVDFPFPDEAQRRRIWEVSLPDGAPREDDVDFGRLGRDFRLSGGNIGNAVLRAAFLAAAQDRPIGMSHLLEAVRREHHNMGKILLDSELRTGPGEG
ncbi:AAA family ATPase [Nonomuraea sp. NPDC003707]